MDCLWRRIPTTQCYIEPRSVAIGVKPNMQTNKQEKVYENRAMLKVSGYGELLIRQRAGQIASICNPVIVYDCDKFEYGEDDAEFTFLIQRNSLNSRC